MDYFATIELTETSRLKLAGDYDSESPREGYRDGVITGFVETVGNSHYSAPASVHDFPGDIERADSELSAEALARWVAIFHPEVAAIEYDSERGGYWFVTREDLAEGFPELADDEVSETAARVLSEERAEYLYWAEGNVYGVILERDDEGIVDSIWGIYNSPGYDEHYVAAEHFDLTADELDALELSPEQITGLVNQVIPSVPAFVDLAARKGVAVTPRTAADLNL